MEPFKSMIKTLIGRSHNPHFSIRDFFFLLFLFVFFFVHTAKGYFQIVLNAHLESSLNLILYVPEISMYLIF